MPKGLLILLLGFICIACHKKSSKEAVVDNSPLASLTNVYENVPMYKYSWSVPYDTFPGGAFNDSLINVTVNLERSDSNLRFLCPREKVDVTYRLSSYNNNVYAFRKEYNGFELTYLTYYTEQDSIYIEYRFGGLGSHIMRKFSIKK